MPNVDDDPEQHANPIYTIHFREHLAHTHAHLAGREPDAVLKCSYHPPSGYWTPEEKERFFHALAVHSRLRPDLLAAAVGTKTLIDVCVYLDELEAAAAALGDADGGRRGRDAAPAALEVSDEWVRTEEEMARTLGERELVWEDAARARDRAAEVKAERRRLRVPKGTAEQAKAGKAELARWKDGREREWARADTLARMNATHLRVMDRILREDEEASSLANARAAAASRTEAGKATQANDVDGSRARPRARDADVAAGSLPQSLADDIPIDPILLAMDGNPATMAVGPPTPGPSTSASAQPPPTPHGPDLTSHHSLPSISSAFSHPPPPSSSLQAPVPAASRRASADPDSLDPVALAALSPTSRRRHQKRLYMRRKRAEAAGVDAPSAHIGRLKPGRKPKARATPAPAKEPADEAAGSAAKLGKRTRADEEEGEESQADEPPRKAPNKGGLTRDYRTRKTFDELGLDAAALRDADLGMFHLSALGKLMGLYKSLHDVPADALTSIDAQAVSLLHAHLVPFVGDAVRAAISVRKFQRSNRAHTKVWRLGKGNGIRAPQVRIALEMMGCETLNRRKHFAELVERLGVSPVAEGEDANDNAVVELDEAGEDEDIPVNVEDDEPDANYTQPDVEDDERNTLDGPPDPSAALGLTLSREVHAPIVRLPPHSYPPPPDAHEKRIAAAHGRALRVEAEVEDDADALLDELREEEALDKRDALVAQMAERSLWAAFAAPPAGVRSDATRGGSGEGSVKEEDPLRMVPPGKDGAGRVKSQVYIVDSD